MADYYYDNNWYWVEVNTTAATDQFPTITVNGVPYQAPVPWATRYKKPPPPPEEPEEYVDFRGAAP